ncbi:unnamed protein product [Moneuplotes crassus]|uniref:Uncharacterized protein n=1 Tax=Euplotes crassus TaxID=5936 RepID=A0AAD1Y9H8_EUPCR|nr:unnamed protein product [Moneuplotes crassus]
MNGKEGIESFNLNSSNLSPNFLDCSFHSKRFSNSLSFFERHNGCNFLILCCNSRTLDFLTFSFIISVKIVISYSSFLDQSNFKLSKSINFFPFRDTLAISHILGSILSLNPMNTSLCNVNLTSPPISLSTSIISVVSLNSFFSNTLNAFPFLLQNPLLCLFIPSMTLCQSPQNP